MSAIANATVGLRRKSVLIVDDNAPVQDALREIAEAAGFAVRVASSRSLAMRLIDRQAFEIAIVDKRLVEHDRQNRDGLAVLRYVHEKAEGTATIFLTAYGEYADAVEATTTLGVFRILEKRIDHAELQQEILSALRDAALHVEPLRSVASPAEVWCGEQFSVNWELQVNNFLRPNGGLPVLLSVLGELAKTCVPILESPSNRGLIKTGDSMLSGLFWSRGVGEVIAVMIARDNVPTTLPARSDWPADVRVDGELYHVRRKNLHGTIVKCSGVDMAEFTVAREYEK